MQANKSKEYEEFLELPRSIRLVIQMKEPNSHKDINHKNMALV